MEKNKIIQGDCLEVLKTLPDNSINCCITSPPYYGLRDYGTGTWVGGDPNCKHVAKGISNNRNFIDENGRGGNNPSIGGTVCKLCGAVREDKQVGLEETPEEYITRLTNIFMEVNRVLTDDGTLWVNIGDSYNSAPTGSVNSSKQLTNVGSLAHTDKNCKHLDKNCKPKDLIGIPWLLAFALRNAGWYLRQDIIWHKPNPMPESVKDRCTKSHEYIFLFAKSQRYYFDSEAIQEPVVDYGTGKVWGEEKFTGMRNKRDVWSVIPSHYKEAHFATFPEELIRPMILAGCPKDGIVLDPFMGSGTTAVVAKQNHRNYLGIELNPEYIKMAENRISTTKKKLF